jgi:antitoxin component YwqK of YwqJK toxin-antitoxin module
LRQGHWIKKYPNGVPQYDGYFVNNNPSGTFTRFYETGKVQSVLKFSKNGTEAEAVFYHPNGFVASKGKYISQIKEGKWQFFSAVTENYLLCEEEYSNNLRHGYSLKFYPDSSLLEKLTYSKDIRTGEWIQYYPDGKICLKAIYINGKLEGKFEVYHTNGNIQYSGQYRDNARDGDWVLYNPDGSVRRRIEYNHGLALNPELYQEESDYLDSLEKNKGKIADPEITGTIWN